MIALPEGITINGSDDVEKQVYEIQQYLKYMADRINYTVLDIGKQISKIETDILALQAAINANNG